MVIFFSFVRVTGFNSLCVAFHLAVMRFSFEEAANESERRHPQWACGAQQRKENEVTPTVWKDLITTNTRRV